jgi:hypothetical protein
VTLLQTSTSTLAAIANSGVNTFEEIDDAMLQFQRLSPAAGDYHLMLTAFLGDGVRSGIYHITESRYISLALKCSENLVNAWVLLYHFLYQTSVDMTSSSSFDVKWSNLDLLRRSLLRAPSDRQLGIYLRDNINQITPDRDYYSRKEELLLLIDSYIKVIESDYYHHFIPRNFLLDF